MNASPDFHPAERMHQSLLASSEKRALLWLAQRMPAAINSDHLTALGFLSLFGVGAGYWYARYSRAGLLIATVFFVLNWFGDSLDGTLARVRNRQRPRYGFYLDHVVDIFGALALLGGMALSGRMTPLVAAGVLIAFLFLSVESYLATYTIGEFHLSFGGCGP